MPMDKTRITGFGSDGSKVKTWTCPSGHLLQPWKASPGSCDGCGAKIHKGDCVMDCRQCNYFLCEVCHPQEKEQEDWFWGSLSYIAEATVQEWSEIATEFNEMAGDFETFMTDISPFQMCEAPKVDRDDGISGSGGKQGKKETKGSPYKKVKQHRAEDEEEVVPAPRAGGGEESKGKTEQRKKGSRSRSKSKSKEAPAPSVEKATKPEEAATESTVKVPERVEDLMDIGQFDLLDLDLEPTSIEKAPEKAQIEVAAVALPDLLFDLDAPFVATSAPVPAAAAAVPAVPGAQATAAPSIGSDSCQLLDFDFPHVAPRTAAATPPLSLGLAPPPAPKTPLFVA